MSVSTNTPAAPAMAAILAFDLNNRLCIRKLGSKAGLAFTGSDLPMALTRLRGAYDAHTTPVDGFRVAAGGREYMVYLTQISGTPKDSEIEPWSLEKLEKNPAALAPSLAAMLPRLDPLLIKIPYLHLGESDFIYKFRPEKERNTDIYRQDPQATELYQSQLCTAIKALARNQERSAGKPIPLDFGAVQYIIPSHFGFCLGVKNAIERAYETLAANPGKRVFMLSELIHNPFVNDDLTRRGLRYLQTDRGIPINTEDKPSKGLAGETLHWDALTPDDIVIIPAFGATDEDKRRLVKKGLAVYPYDATCMLVEKVWKAAHTYGREGYSVLIHGKHEHEETKATFSNTRRYAPALIVRNLEEARILGEVIMEKDETTARARFEATFSGRHTPNFDVRRDLERIAVVNQTTLLSNETLEIIDFLREIYLLRFGDESRVGGHSKRDTLCYATQVNQDALCKALDASPDVAFVIGGTNSSNTYQLYKLCENKLGPRAFFIQSECAIPSHRQVSHFVYGGKQGQGQTTPNHVELRPLWDKLEGTPKILITGGASCPDGIIQQVIQRINSFFPQDQLRPIEDVLRDLSK